MDEIKNRGRFLLHPIRRHGNRLRRRPLVSHHPDSLNEVADESLPLGYHPILQELSEVRNVLLDLFRCRNLHPPLLKLVAASSLAVFGCSSWCLRDMMRSDRTSRFRSLVSTASKSCPRPLHRNLYPVHFLQEPQQGYDAAAVLLPSSQ